MNQNRLLFGPLLFLFKRTAFLQKQKVWQKIHHKNIKKQQKIA